MRQPLFKSNRGFTLIELLLAMSFVSVLLIFILTATLQVTRIYNKGITLKQVNQSGANIGTELQASLKAADPPQTDTINNGRLCLGDYSYVWNLLDTSANKYAGSDSETRIGLVKVSDTTKEMCDGNRAVDKSRATELILGAQGDNGAQLQLRNFSVTKTANSGINYIYHVSYTLATSDQDLIQATSSTDGACKGGPGDDFCALNSFEFDVFVRVGGSGKVN